MRSSSVIVLILAAAVAAPLSAQQAPLRKQRSLAELDHLRSLESLKGLKSLAHLGEGVVALREGLQGLQGLQSLQELQSLQTLQGMHALEGLEALRGLESLRALGGLDAAWDNHYEPQDIVPEAWNQQDPADQLYRRARESFNRRRYTEAAEMFQEVYTKHPRSSYAGDAYYWEAFALYRRGGNESLRRAAAVLQEQEEKAPGASTRRDAESLETRVLTALSEAGDEAAARRLEERTRRIARTRVDVRTPVRNQARSGRQSRCDDDERSAVLDATLSMDASRAVPILKRVMAQQDAGSACLRRKAVFIISQKEHPDTPKLLMDAVRSDPDVEVREQAVFWLSQVDLPEAVVALDSILRSSRDQAVQEKAIFALSQHNSRRAAQALRAYAARNDAPQSLRENAIFWLSQSNDPENIPFLRDLFLKVQDRGSKDKIIFAISQKQNAESQRWLLQIAGDRNQPVEIRKQSLFWAGQMKGSPQEFFNLYETFSDQEMKEHLIFIYSQNNSRAAVDKLMQIARSEPNPELRKKAVFWLGQSNDPRVPDFLGSLLDRRPPQ
jgi:TolA-binding protein